MPRKSKYKPEYCEGVIAHLKTGASLASFAAKVGTHRETLWQWRQVNPEFDEACKIATDASQSWYENLALLVATGKAMDIEMDPESPKFGKPRLPFTNPGMIQFILSRRFKDYRQNMHIEQDITFTDDPERMSDKELDESVKEALEVVRKNGSTKSDNNTRGKGKETKKKTTRRTSKRKST